MKVKAWYQGMDAMEEPVLWSSLAAAVMSGATVVSAVEEDEQKEGVPFETPLP